MTSNDAKNKYCSKCKITKPIKEYGRNKSAKDGYQFYCRQCRHLGYVEYKKRYPEKVAAQGRAIANRYRKKHPDRVRENNKKWERENIDYRKTYLKMSGARWRKNNPEKKKATSDAWYVNNKRRVKNNVRRWQANNKSKVLEYNRTRRALIIVSGGKITDREWIELLKEAGYKCLKCGDTRKLTLDHIRPLSTGGKHEKQNAQVLCHSCNCSKGVQETDYRYINQ